MYFAIIDERQRKLYSVRIPEPLTALKMCHGKNFLAIYYHILLSFFYFSSVTYNTCIRFTLIQLLIDSYQDMCMV